MDIRRKSLKDSTDSFSTKRWNWLRMVLLDQKEKQANTIRSIQKHRSPVLDAYFAVADVCGDEIFFVLFLPFCIWILGNHRLALHMAVLIPYCIGGGNYLKNLFQIPRPSGVWVADGVQRRDHGFPSTHTITGVAAPLYFFVYHYIDHDPTNYPISMPAAAVMTLAWSSSIIFSRLYNGFHSPQDVAFGFVLGWVAFFSWYSFGRSMIDSWVFSVGNYIPMVTTVLGGIILMWLHPRPLEPTPCVAETAVVVGTSTGGVLSFQLLQNYYIAGYFEPISTVATSSIVTFLRAYPVLFYIARYLFGAMVVLLVRMILKKYLRQLFQILGITSPTQNDDVPLKFVCYFVVTMTVIVLVPGLYTWLGLHNSTDYCPYGSVCH